MRPVHGFHGVLVLCPIILAFVPGDTPEADRMHDGEKQPLAVFLVPTACATRIQDDTAALR
jgi:hypothetical protein